MVVSSPRVQALHSETLGLPVTLAAVPSLADADLAAVADEVGFELSDLNRRLKGAKSSIALKRVPIPWTSGVPFNPFGPGWLACTRGC